MQVQDVETGPNCSHELATFLMAFKKSNKFMLTIDLFILKGAGAHVPKVDVISGFFVKFCIEKRYLLL